MEIGNEPLIGADAIQARVEDLGAEISEAYAGRTLTVIPVLKGACLFAADLVRHVSVPVHLEFIRAKSYRGTLSTGAVEFTVLPECSMTGCDVLVVEDILDTGHTAAAILDRLMADAPASLALCTLLDKPSRRVREVYADYVGFTIDNRFVVGYGLDCDEVYRNLPGVYVLEAG